MTKESTPQMKNPHNQHESPTKGNANEVHPKDAPTTTSVVVLPCRHVLPPNFREVVFVQRHGQVREGVIRLQEVRFEILHRLQDRGFGRLRHDPGPFLGEGQSRFFGFSPPGMSRLQVRRPTCASSPVNGARLAQPAWRSRVKPFCTAPRTSYWFLNGGMGAPPPCRGLVFVRTKF